jgi:hypothetical protein
MAAASVERSRRAADVSSAAIKAALGRRDLDQDGDAVAGHHGVTVPHWGGPGKTSTATSKLATTVPT